MRPLTSSASCLWQSFARMKPENFGSKKTGVGFPIEFTISADELLSLFGLEINTLRTGFLLFIAEARQITLGKLAYFIRKRETLIF